MPRRPRASVRSCIASAANGRRPRTTSWPAASIDRWFTRSGNVWPFAEGNGAAGRSRLAAGDVGPAGLERVSRRPRSRDARSGPIRSGPRRGAGGEGASGTDAHPEGTLRTRVGNSGPGTATRSSPSEVPSRRRAGAGGAAPARWPGCGMLPRCRPNGMLPTRNAAPRPPAPFVLTAALVSTAGSGMANSPCSVRSPRRDPELTVIRILASGESVG